MTHNRASSVRSWLLMSFFIGSSLTFGSCSGNKKEASTETTTAASDSSVFGRQGDTANNNLNAPIQAPPDSGDRGAVVPAEIKVRPKNK